MNTAMDRLPPAGRTVAKVISMLMLIEIADDPKNGLSASDKKKLLKRRDALKREIDSERAARKTG